MWGRSWLSEQPLSWWACWVTLTKWFIRIGQITKSSRQNEFAMKDSITLTALDGHSFEVYLATPAGKPKAAVVVVQEIFGVNAHIKEVADRFTAAGYLVIAPALFDRIAPDITLVYDGDGVAKGRGLAAAISYYGGELPSLVGRDAACPVMAHFGIHDASIPEAGARSFATAQSSVETHFYDAGHGFNCDHRGQYDADAAALAWRRTMAFLETHLA